MNRQEFETNINSIIGEVVQKVYYYEIDYKNDKEHWNSDKQYDSVDFGFDLLLESGKTVGVIWGSEFYQYGVSFVPFSLESKLKGNRKINVTKNSRWQEITGSKIQDVRIIWSWVKENGFLKNKIHYPQDLIFSFSNGKEIFISALEIKDNEPFGFIDNITIFFEKATAIKYGVGL